ncbi:uncharacterized protein MYCFIDRAFT_178758 [Pseudocercospora fijiensis CIRAD86]|uniref:Uncharacterized protein n=1 Tax=Pseudocercospora fijiensis (strain CIRAD86) TaxID=383855 RepID=M2YLM4_PSEFD|nr:uncharacterized protein MYCFIDRAFT_178758 [Pseudocercospora fijiensis CIRAD86]EME78645.1 hypothetical protein MYCFIDRAFT_178758 [Pseudocercospora fijiensis CIRAD86]
MCGLQTTIERFTTLAFLVSIHRPRVLSTVAQPDYFLLASKAFQRSQPIGHRSRQAGLIEVRTLLAISSRAIKEGMKTIDVRRWESKVRFQPLGH